MRCGDNWRKEAVGCVKNGVEVSRQICATSDCGGIQRSQWETPLRFSIASHSPLRVRLILSVLRLDWPSQTSKMPG